MIKKLGYLGFIFGLMVSVAPADQISLLTERATSAFTHTFTGADIHDSTGAGFQNGWVGGTGGITYTTTGSILNITTTGSAHAGILNGTDSTDGGIETWNSGVVGPDDPYTIELTLRVNNAPNGIRLWIGHDTERNDVDLFNDRLLTTNSGTGIKTVPADLTSGFNTIRFAYDGGPGNSDVHVWLNGTAVTDPSGGVYNTGGNDSRLLFGDYTSGVFGDDFNVDLATFSYDTSGAFAPVAIPEPRNLLGLGLIWLVAMLRKRS